jgi:hypothetical protein
MRHVLSFRGEDYEIPAGYGRCVRCGWAGPIEEWLRSECPEVKREEAGAQ